MELGFATVWFEAQQKRKTGQVATNFVKRSKIYSDFVHCWQISTVNLTNWSKKYYFIMRNIILF